MDSELKRTVGEGLDLVESLRSLLPSSSPIQLPSIVVVGCQSAGKSSLIERLSGVSLPMAEKLCTRAPLVLRLRQSKDASAEPRYWIRGPKCNERQLAEAEVAPAVAAMTDDLTDSGMDITDQPIHLTVEGPDLYDYTLIDMPGLVYTASGGQSEDIGERVRKLITTHIEQENTVILCVFMGGLNPEAQEALKVAMEVDPHGARTIGVLTKMDLQLSNSGPTEFREVLLQSRAHEKAMLKLGMFAVRNRTQKELNDELPLDKLDEMEQDLIREYEVEDLSSQIGKDKLAAKLAEILAGRVHSWLPKLLPNLEQERQKSIAKLAGMTICSGEFECYRRLHQLAAPLGKHLSELERGTLPSDLIDASPVHHATILLGEELRKAMAQTVAQQTLTIRAGEAIAATLTKYQGAALPDFIDYRVFEILAKPIVASCSKLVRSGFAMCCQQFRSFFKECSLAAVQDHPDRVQTFFKSQAMLHCDNEVASAIAHLDSLFQQEDAKVLTLNNYYMDTKQNMLATLNTVTDEDGEQQLRADIAKTYSLRLSDAMTLRTSASSHDTKQQRMLTFQLSLYAYCKVVRKRLIDDAWKAFWSHLLINSTERLTKHFDSISKETIAKCLGSTHKEEQAREAEEARLRSFEEASQKVHAFFGNPDGQTHVPVFNASQRGAVESQVAEEDDEEEVFVAVPYSGRSGSGKSAAFTAKGLEWHVEIAQCDEGYDVALCWHAKRVLWDVKCVLLGNPPLEVPRVSSSSWDLAALAGGVAIIPTAHVGRYCDKGQFRLCLTFVGEPTEAKTEPEPEPEAQPVTEPEAQPEAETEPQAEAEAEPQAEAETETQTETQSDE